MMTRRLEIDSARLLVRSLIACAAAHAAAVQVRRMNHAVAACNEWRVQLFGKLIKSRYLSKRLDLSAPPNRIYIGCYPTGSLPPNSDRASGVVIKDLRIFDQLLNEAPPSKREGTPR
jgi:hypothetical protein